ncbi:unnamed protein product [Hydatigera taeniaeformis]|uniref:DNA excision repair protein ERCC-6 n=1 Tax=Hydatigena taeniaeformis TaxID=6205 RepID=A0A0R3WZR3_HYDTA|nr:unnamed protein product [Hydatigera taeniaeformis]
MKLGRDARSLCERDVDGSSENRQRTLRTSSSNQLQQKCSPVQTLLSSSKHTLGFSDIDCLITETASLSICEDVHETAGQQTAGTLVSANTSAAENKIIVSIVNAPNELLDRARLLYEEEKIAESLALLEQAYSLDPNPKTARKIARLKEALAEQNEFEAEAARKSSVNLERRARALFHCKDYRGTLNLLLEADKLCPSDKLKRRIGRLRDLMAEEEQENDDRDKVDKDDDTDALIHSTANLSLKAQKAVGGGNVIELAEGFFLPRGLYEQLYPYQREGVSWLWNLHKSAPGGILADDMGLGKTLQTITFLTGYFLSEEATKKPPTAIILAPVSVLQTWQSEFSKWSPSMRLIIYYEMVKNARRHALLSFQSRGGILLTTYNMLVSGIQDIAADQHYHQTEPPTWLSSSDPRLYTRAFTYDYVILDEAHRIKNPSTKVAKAVRTLDCHHRLLLTGTAIQNNLRELWSLFDFTHTGCLLGSQKTFLLQYEKPILRSRDRDASAAERLHGNLMAESLNKIIRPYLLRRTKQDTLTILSAGAMPHKNEIVVWVYLSSLQEHIYRSFLKLDHVKELLFGGKTQRSPLVELTILKKLCDHPRLLSTQQCANLGLDVSKALPGSEIRAPSHEVLLQESGKMAFVVRLLEHFQKEALRTGEPVHRTLIFSQSVQLLNMMEVAILGLNRDLSSSPGLMMHRVLRLDGRLKPDERVAVLKQFAHDRSYTAMLLTTQVGGVGLTITSADRVVILDPSWNPSVDAQAVDRVYRIGQHSNVVVYRLITCATVEEKIYRRQVFKDSVIRQTIGRASADRPADADVTDPYRYFTRQELVELFSLDENARFSATQRQLAELHNTAERRTYPELESHLTFLKSMTDLVFDISDHDLLFSRQDDVEHTEETVFERLFAENRLKVGEAALKMEAVKDFKGSKKIQQQVFAPSKPAYSQPAGDIFIPSKRDTQRAMFNAPRCGKTDSMIATNVNPGNELKQTFDSVGGVLRAPVAEQRLMSAEPLCSSVSPGKSSSADLIELDPTELVDDAALEKSIQMLSLRKSLAMSGIFLGDEAESPVKENEPKADVVVGDSCCEETDEGSKEVQGAIVAETSSDSVEVIEATFSGSD